LKGTQSSLVTAVRIVPRHHRRPDLPVQSRSPVAEEAWTFWSGPDDAERLRIALLVSPSISGGVAHIIVNCLIPVGGAAMPIDSTGFNIDVIAYV